MGLGEWRGLEMTVCLVRVRFLIWTCLSLINSAQVSLSDPIFDAPTPQYWRTMLLFLCSGTRLPGASLKPKGHFPAPVLGSFCPATATDTSAFYSKRMKFLRPTGWMI